MVLLSLGPQAVAALLWHGGPARSAAPDLAWLLAAPEAVAAASADSENAASMRYGEFENILSFNALTG